MTYEDAIADLFRRHPSVQGHGFTPGAYKPGLDTMLAFDRALGSPWRRYRCVHVAGTNGKGSVCSMLAASLASDGTPVGLYTSPHIHDFRERMKIVRGGGFEMIREDEVLEFLRTYDSVLAGLSFFEITTGMAFWWFARRGVAYAVVETGLGGRLDSTNVITPALSVVTSIGLDHCALLGDTRAEIAAEKAGIFKRGVPALVWGHDPETDPVFTAAAGSGLHFAEGPCDIGEGDLTGSWQLANRRTALSALRLIGVDPCPSAILRAAQITGLHGRWELLDANPETVCDIGHNPPALAENFRRLSLLGQTRSLIIVYGIMADKDLSGIAPLMPSGAKYFLCAPKGERAMECGELAGRLSVLRPDLDCTRCSSVQDAVRRARALAATLPDPFIYIGGSTFVVAEI